MPELPITYRGTVSAAQCDHMGHMNVAWYVAKFDEATWHVFNMLGLSPSFIRDNGRGMAGVQQNLSYKRELRAGDILTVRSAVLEVRPKTLRFIHEMWNDETGELAATCELTAVYIDTTSRKSCPFPPETFERGRALVAGHATAMGAAGASAEAAGPHPATDASGAAP